MKAWVTLRGYQSKPTIMEVDLSSCEIVREVKLDHELSQGGKIPPSKVGTTGLFLRGNKIYIGVWDGVFVLEKNTLKVLNFYTSQRFSDIHGVFVDADNVVWVANTNLDGIYIIENGKWDVFWHSWESNQNGVKFDPDKDYRELTKNESPFHSMHVNGVIVVNDKVLVSFLGTASRGGFFRRIKRKIGMKDFARKGGVMLFDRRTKRMLRKISTGGLHDPILVKSELVAFPEYFSNRILLLNLNSMKIDKVLPLDKVPMGYLTRGIAFFNDCYWIGHSVRRGWEEKCPFGLIRQYNEQGEWTGKEVKLSNYVGLYQIVMELG